MAVSVVKSNAIENRNQKDCRVGGYTREHLILSLKYDFKNVIIQNSILKN